MAWRGAVGSIGLCGSRVAFVRWNREPFDDCSMTQRRLVYAIGRSYWRRNSAIRRRGERTTLQTQSIEQYAASVEVGETSCSYQYEQIDTSTEG